MLTWLASVMNFKPLHTGCPIAHGKSCYDHQNFDGSNQNHLIKSNCSIVSVATTIRRNKLWLPLLPVSQLKQ